MQSMIEPLIVPFFEAVALGKRPGMGGLGQSIGGQSMFAELNFLSPTLDPRITFTRASTKTYFDATGTMQTAAVNACPLEYDPATLLPVGRSFWEARTNNCLYSNDFNAAGWSKNNFTSSPSYGLGPDGSLDTSQIAFPGSGGGAASRGFAVTAGSTYTLSTHFRPGSISKVQLRDYSVAGYAEFDLVAKTVVITGSFTGGVIQKLQNGLYRLSATTVATTTAVRSYGFGMSAAAAAGDFEMFGFQMEAAAFAGPYIPTTTAVVTRAADVATVNDLSTLGFNAAAGTLYSEFNSPMDNSAGRRPVCLNDGTANNRIEISAASTASFSIVTGGVLQAVSGSLGIAYNSPTKAGISWSALSAAGTINGSAPLTKNGAITVPAVNQLVIGALTNAGYLSNTVRKIRIYPRQLSSSELQALTT